MTGTEKILGLISLACVGSETHNLQAVFLRIYDTKGRSLCQASVAEIVETGNKNRCVTEATHVLRRKLKPCVNGRKLANYCDGRVL